MFLSKSTILDTTGIRGGTAGRVSLGKAAFVVVPVGMTSIVLQTRYYRRR